MLDSANIFFIGGVGRSGTSITRRLLGENSNIYTFPFEYRFIIDPDGIIDFINTSSESWSPFLYDKKLKRLEAFLLKLAKPRGLSKFSGDVIRFSNILKKNITASSYHGWRLADYFHDYEKKVSLLIEELHQFSYRGSWVGSDSFSIKNEIYYSSPVKKEKLHSIFNKFLLDLLGELLFSCNKKYIVEDNTWNLLFLEELLLLFPDAKFIHVYRDPRDIISSYKNQRWMPSNIEKSSIICKDLYDKIISNIKKVTQDKILEISLEKLVLDKENTINNISNFLDIDITPEMLSFNLSSSSLSRWERELSSSEEKIVTSILGSVLDYYHYT